MRILFLTQYYPPEVGAPQNRLHELAVRMKRYGIDVEVLTAMPNYPSMEIHEAYRSGKIREEVIDGIKVYRSKIFVSTSKNILPRLLNYFSFVWTSYFRGRKLGRYDFLLVESPPLFLGYSAMRLAKKMQAKLIFNVSDLWPESAEKMGVVNNQRLLKMAYRLEEKCYKRAALVTGQTQGIVDNINKRFPEVRTYWLPNGVDLGFYDPEKTTSSGFRQRNGIAEEKLVLFYGGILGHAQGLSLVIEAASKVKNDQITIVLQGSGPEKDELVELNQRLGNKNVLFLPPVSKDKMPGILCEVDVALVPLRKLDIFMGAIPSKIFEALSMRKALLLGVDGEARTHFIERAEAGLFFEPENLNELVAGMEFLSENRLEMKEMGVKGRAYVQKVFNRDAIAQDFISELEKVAKY
ncbi:MAG: glycosyltransferase WbuB [Bacteroidetes bacterium]|nr:MAG: glycosyltransferase WbuB [Bacteroidota bacterium]